MKSVQEWASEYEASTRYFENLAHSVAEENLDVRHPNGWCARQIIHHCADSEAQSYSRLRRLLAEPEGSSIQGYDENMWAQNPTLGYEVLPVKNSLLVFSAVRAASLDLIKRLQESDLQKSGVHTESGTYTIEKWLETYTRHPHDHGKQMERAVKGEE